MKLSNVVRLAEIILVSTIALSIGAVTRAAEGGAPSQRTQVVVFSPGIPGGPSKAGYCWTDSIAVNRRGAWRCMKENEIYDPCFQVQGLAKALVCDANPASLQHGFIMKLTKALPKPSSEPGVVRTWGRPNLGSTARGCLNSQMDRYARSKPVRLRK
jgi:hypothetical protein